MLELNLLKLLTLPYSLINSNLVIESGLPISKIGAECVCLWIKPTLGAKFLNQTIKFLTSLKQVLKYTVLYVTENIIQNQVKYQAWLLVDMCVVECDRS